MDKTKQKSYLNDFKMSDELLTSMKYFKSDRQWLNLTFFKAFYIDD
jgi:hypothetical protein